MHAITPPLTQAYADFVADSATWAMPPEIQEVVVLGFTDAIGVMLAGARENAVSILTQWALMQGGQSHARVVSCQDALPTAQAALINATAAHALDYDDFAFSNHPSAVLVPTILAVADARPASGATMARAYAVGYEVWADLFLREKDLYYDKGWHPTAILGTVGAAAAAAVVQGLSATQTRHALALAASSAGVFLKILAPWQNPTMAAAPPAPASQQQRWPPAASKPARPRSKGGTACCALSRRLAMSTSSHPLTVVTTGTSAPAG